MDKKKLIGEIIDLVDKVEELERENEELKKTKEKDLSFVDLENAGRKKLFEYVKSYCLYYSYDVKKGEKLLTFYEWLDTLDIGIFSMINFKALNNHSAKELVMYFENELNDVYNEKLGKIEKMKGE